MSDILDALDAINGAEALVKEWEREFLREWYRPALQAAAASMRSQTAMGVGRRPMPASVPAPVQKRQMGGV